MAGNVETCEVCGRHPAKQMSFKAHQGFVVFRREVSYSGMFCRDHAIEAYAKARGATLKGMWFSPTALLFGGLRSIFDSAALLGLPEPVKDGPLVFHKVGCPGCAAAAFVPAGPVKCSQCGVTMSVLSCEECSTPEVVSGKYPPSQINFRCKGCNHVSNWPMPIRNSLYVLQLRTFAELLTLALKRGGLEASNIGPAAMSATSETYEESDAMILDLVRRESLAPLLRAPDMLMSELEAVFGESLAFQQFGRRIKARHFFDVVQAVVHHAQMVLGRFEEGSPVLKMLGAIAFHYHPMGPDQ